MTAADVRAIRVQALATVAQCDAILAREAPIVDDVKASQPKPEGCPHESVVSSGVMGAPRRRRCLGCGASLDGEPESESVNHVPVAS